MRNVKANKKTVFAVIASCVVLLAIILVLFIISDNSISDTSESTCDYYSDVTEILNEKQTEDYSLHTTTVIVTATTTPTSTPASTTVSTTSAPATPTKVVTSAASTSKIAPSDSLSEKEMEVFYEMNKYRTSIGLSEFTFNKKLSDLAAIRAREAATSFSHTRPDGRKMITVFTDYDLFRGCDAAEILARVPVTDTAKMLIDGWNGSPPHHASIINPVYEDMGVGIYESGGQLYAAVLFLDYK